MALPCFYHVFVTLPHTDFECIKPEEPHGGALINNLQSLRWHAKTLLVIYFSHTHTHTQSAQMLPHGPQDLCIYCSLCAQSIGYFHEPTHQLERKREELLHFVNHLKWLLTDNNSRV